MRDAMKLACALALHYASTIPMARKWNIAWQKNGLISNKFWLALNAMKPLGYGQHF
jgi:hypothetical protein